MLELKGLQYEIFSKRYAMPGESKWFQLAKRVGDNIALMELNGLASEWSQKFRDAIAAGDFMPGGRILFGAGRRQFNMLNCYRLHPEDTVESIGKTIRDTYLISCGGGGIGYNFSDIRPKGDDIQNIRWSAPGAVSVMRMINEVGEHVRSGKNRRTALIAILNVTHPDLFEFLHVKLDLDQLQNFNISVGVNNEFINAVKKNKQWYFRFNGRRYDLYEVDRITPTGGRPKVETVRIVALNEEDAIGRAMNHYRTSEKDRFENPRRYTLYAREIWETIIENSCKSGDPGIYNIDFANQYTNVSYFENLDSTNPCGEIPLPKYGNCCLGHLNLSNMYNSRTNDVHWKKLAATIRVAIRFLDDVLGVNHYPIPECKTVGERSRRIGMGVTGLHYLLLKLGYVYGDEKCLDFLDRLFATIRNESYKASIDLAKEKGAFPAFDAEKYAEEGFFNQLPPRIQNAIKKYGIRNAIMLTIAPCGTNSIVLGVSSGIEPIFAPVYMRRFLDGNVWREEYVADPLFVEFYRNNKDVSHFIGAHDIDPETHIQVQATIQKYVDSSISKTINLPEDFIPDTLGEKILEHLEYIKGMTVYRTGSKGMEPLQPVDTSTPEKLEQAIEAAGIGIETIEACRDGKCDL